MNDHLLMDAVTYLAGGRRILDGVSLRVGPGQRTGIIGENGTGKSTALKLLAGVIDPHSGRVERPADVGYLAQELPFEPDATLGEVVADALRTVRETLERLDAAAEHLAGVPADDPGHAAASEAYAERLAEAQRVDAWAADRRAARVLRSLTLDTVPADRPLRTLSGGQRGRLALAALLLRQPAALVLDEPTNHLDEAAVAFLEEQLRVFPGVLVLASHDRALLDAVCTGLVDLDPAAAGPVAFGGGYSAYIGHKRAARQRWEQRHREEQEEIYRLARIVVDTDPALAPARDRRDSEKMGYGHRAGRVQNQVARRVRDARRRLEDAVLRQVAAPPPPLRLTAPDVALPASDGPLVELSDIEVPGRLRVPRLTVEAGEKLLITGPNGAGKSTLLGVIAGEVEFAGHLRRDPDAAVSYLAQDTVFERPDRSAEQIYLDTVGEHAAERVPLTALGLLTPREAGVPVGELSVGQRRRLALALLFARPPHLLLLDEPTNHLSPTLVDELEDAFARAPGAIVVAGHDRLMRSRWQGRVFALDGPGGPAEAAGPRPSDRPGGSAELPIPAG
ncbi:ABC-F family ATP-binding cassette domain-containing protein [Promicromonospora sukumoe]|uniref:ABC-F family ATP-binding cassette domain-containing protein n=1 Tax=Promicromonospora sukumoe TaxID=88382 RepID=UPI0003A2753C|nr:ATP-binding cassette domain-containing protein [Promicromonospora sukumoe]